MHELTGKQKRYLRGLAHDLKPLGLIGKQGVTDAFLHSLEESLSHHELVKIKFIDRKDEKDELCEEIASRLNCAIAGRVGHQAILFRPAREREKRKIRLPAANLAANLAGKPAAKPAAMLAPETDGP